MGHGGSACAMWRWPQVGGAGRLDEPDAARPYPPHPSHPHAAGAARGRWAARVIMPRVPCKALLARGRGGRGSRNSGAEISSPGRPAATPRSHHFVAGRGAGRAVCAGAGPGVVGLALGRIRTQHAHLRKKQTNAAARTRHTPRHGSPRRHYPPPAHALDTYDLTDERHLQADPPSLAPSAPGRDPFHVQTDHAPTAQIDAFGGVSAHERASACLQTSSKSPAGCSL